ncbi:MAG: hypothetical protein K8T89_20920 [Planctomycetes bacterium]|nr:hypothetical protein [Planctomycetota bacterium]
MLLKILGILLIVGGVAGLGLHLFLYFDGHYQQQADDSVRLGKQLAGTRADPEKDAAKAKEYVIQDLNRGFLFAGTPLVIGIAIYMASRRKGKSVPI